MRIASLSRLVPGLLLTGTVATAALGLERMEVMITGRAWLEALVLAILLGTLVRTLRKPPAACEPGIHCATKTMLELAVMLMGATISFAAIAAAGVPLLVAIAVTVAAAIAASFTLGRVLGLPKRMAVLVACGNAICGNSAIAAVAPVIHAEFDDVATSIAFTAVLGIAVVVALPFAAHLLHLSPIAGGMLAGLTVYAVPQVLAAAGPLGSAAVQVGTLVKLVRVLMLGPVVGGLSLLMARRPDGVAPRPRAAIAHLMPPFIIGFLALAALNSLALLPGTVIVQARAASGLLTVLAMAGLGLGVDLRSVAAAGPRVIFVVTASLLALGAMAVFALHLLHLA